MELDKKTLPIVIAIVLALFFFGDIMEFLGVREPVPEGAGLTDSTGQAIDTAVTYSQTQPIPSGAIEAERTDPVVSAPPGDTIPTDTIPLEVDTILIHTNKFDVVMTTLGGGPVSMILKEYTLRDGSPIDMLPNAKVATPEAVFGGGTYSTARMNFVSNVLPGEYSVTSSDFTVEYSYTAPNGGTIIRRFVFSPDDYHYDHIMELVEPDKMGLERRYSLEWNTPLRVTEPQVEVDYTAMEAVAYMGGSRTSLDDFEDNKLRQSEDGQTTWAGLRQKYFSAIMIPGTREGTGVKAQGRIYNQSTPDGLVEAREITVGLNMDFMGPIVDSFRVFVGPMDYMLMSEYNVELEEMMDIGTTPVVGILIKPFAIGVMWLLPKLYDVIPNYGIVILLFALIVKLVTMPLSAKSFRSMQAMKEIQPKVKELQDKYKKDPAKMQKETMALYKKHGVSPLSGCLPILPQMPLFIAMFRVFQSTILLRDAPFVFFITDLSRGASGITDPYILLVVVMVVAQFLSQQLTMPSAGGAQGKMFAYIMPLFMGFIFYSFASGLVLYWIGFSIFSLLDYVAFKRKTMNEQVKILPAKK